MALHVSDDDKLVGQQHIPQILTCGMEHSLQQISGIVTTNVVAIFENVVAIKFLRRQRRRKMSSVLTRG